MRLIGLLLGAALLLLGVPLTVSPVPLGFVLVVLGAVLLSASHPPFARWLGRLRRRHEAVDGVLDRAQEVLPRPLAEPLEATDPQEARQGAPGPAPALGPPIRRLAPGTPYKRLLP